MVDVVDGRSIDYSNLDSNFSHRIMLSISSRIISEKRKEAIVFVVTSAVMVIAFLSLYGGINRVFPHLFYIPIIVATFWYPEKGVLFSFSMGLVYITEFLLCVQLFGSVPLSDFLTVVSRSMVFLLVGTVLAVLRWESHTINSIIGDINKFVFVHDGKKGDFYYSPSIYELVDDIKVHRIGKSGIESIISDDEKEKYRQLSRKAMAGEEVSDIFRIKGRDGGDRVMSFTLMPMVNNGGVKGFRGMVDDVTKYKEYEETIEAALQEKTVLLAEVHHRVRNNLAIIMGFINMQILKVDDDVARGCLKEAENRILAISSVHSSIYQNEQMVDIDINQHISNMSQQIVDNNLPRIPVDLVLEVEHLKMGFNETMDISLILNELISNSMKHGFTGMEEGKISIRLEREGDRLVLTYSDNGVGMTDDHEIGEGFGLSIVSRMVTGKLKGSMERMDGPGTIWHIRIPYRGGR